MFATWLLITIFRISSDIESFFEPSIVAIVEAVISQKQAASRSIVVSVPGFSSSPFSLTIVSTISKRYSSVVLLQALGSLLS
jgi:hypothetical protein